MENAILLLMLAAPVLLLAAAVRVRRAREARGTVAAPPARVTAAKPWDKTLRNAMLIGLTGLLLLPAGLYAFSLLSSRRWAPVFMVPVVAGVVMISMGYRTWMRGVSQVPDE